MFSNSWDSLFKLLGFSSVDLELLMGQGNHDNENVILIYECLL